MSSIGNSAFANCSGLTGPLVIPESVVSVSNYAFAGCSSLTGTLVIPSTWSSIGLGVFEGCKGITGSLIIPSTITTIQSSAFSDLSGLTGTVEIPASVVSIGEGAFFTCGAPFNIDADNEYYASIDGVLFSKNLKTLFFCPTSISGSYTIPSTVQSVAGVAFKKCVYLSSIIIPNSVTSLSYNTFYNCSNLASIYSYATTPTSNYNGFYNVNKTTCTLYVPKNSKSLYAVADQWKDFLNIVEMTPTTLPNQDSETISIYPNPTTEGFKVSGIEGSALLTLTDVNGKLVLAKEVRADEFVSVNSLPSGVYIARVTSGGGIKVEKIVKK